MRFFAFHGFYPEEQKTGNHFVVDVYISTQFQEASETDHLEGTVNYELVYELVKHEMTKPSKLLEHVGDRIHKKLLASFSKIERLRVDVSKLNPPFSGIADRVKISIGAIEL